MNKVNSITILVPLYNEAAVLPELISRLQVLIDHTKIGINVLFVDDGSSDHTASILMEKTTGQEKFSAIFLSRNFGHSMALTAGLAHINDASDAVFIIDGDLQDPPELLPQFLEKMEEGFDVVYGVRTNRKEGFFKKACYKIYYRLLKRFSNITMPLDAGDFSILSKRVVQHLNSLPEESRYLRGLRSWVGFRQTGLKYHRESRKGGGKTKYSLRSLFRLAFNGIFNFSEFPIRFIGVLGFVTIFISLLYLAITIYKKLVFGTVPEGFTALIFAIVLLSGVQLLSLGIIGEYILRIFFQVKQRPLYIVKSKVINGKEINE
ncbi:MAG: glycosyltransferase family 2 protein [Gloeobacteraceae cyanobacterium ES-bin-316]|nr:glycosyltransferase family 2 protein [Ferruginibacter sp.]